MRILKATLNDKFFGTVSSYFDSEHWRRLADVAAEFSGNAPGVYTTLNREAAGTCNLTCSITRDHHLAHGVGQIHFSR